MDIVEGSAPSGTKEEVTNNSLRAIDVELTILGTFARSDRRKIVVINLDRLAPYEGKLYGSWSVYERRDPRHQNAGKNYT
jgi:hypothetical protein